jgi:O-antigen ligase
MDTQKKDSLLVTLAAQLFILVLCSSILVSPFAVWPYSIVQFEVPRVVFWQMASVVLMLLALWSLAFRKGFAPILNKKLWLILLVWVGGIGISVWTNHTWNDSWTGNFYRHDGLQTLSALVCLAMAVSISWRNSWQKVVAISQVCALACISAWTLVDTLRLWQGAGGLIPTMNGAVGVSFGQPNFLAGYLLITLPWLYFLWQDTASKTIRVFLGLVGLLSCLAIVATQSWATALGIGLFLLGLICIYSNKTTYLLGLAVLFAMAFNGYAYWEGHLTFFPESRARIFYRAHLAILEKPLLGWGWARVDEALTRYPWPTQVLHDVYIDKAHSHFLEMAVTTGLVGLGAYLFFVYTLFGSLHDRLQTNKTDKHWYATLLLILALYIFHTQTNVIGIAEEIPFWLVVGWMLLA